MIYVLVTVIYFYQFDSFNTYLHTAPSHLLSVCYSICPIVNPGSKKMHAIDIIKHVHVQYSNIKLAKIR